MNVEIFKRLRKELRESYGITKPSEFFPFEDWRKKLKYYPEDFKEEWGRDIELLKKKLRLINLRKINNHKKKLILFSGIPGAGKTTLAEIVQKTIPNTILIRGHEIVDLLELYGKNVDVYRERLNQRGFQNPDPWYISYLYQENITSYLLDLGYNVVFDDHIRTRINREGYYNLARNLGATNIFIQINAPFETYFQREEDSNNKLNFLARFVFQSQDFSSKEKGNYKIIEIDGTDKLNNIKKSLDDQLKKI